MAVKYVFVTGGKRNYRSVPGTPSESKRVSGDHAEV